MTSWSWCMCTATVPQSLSSNSPGSTSWRPRTAQRSSRSWTSIRLPSPIRRRIRKMMTSPEMQKTGFPRFISSVITTSPSSCCPRRKSPQFPGNNPGSGRSGSKSIHRSHHFRKRISRRSGSIQRRSLARADRSSAACRKISAARSWIVPGTDLSSGSEAGRLLPLRRPNAGQDNPEGKNSEEVQILQ